MKATMFFAIDWIKTIRFNYRYWGGRGVIGCYALLSKNVDINKRGKGIITYAKPIRFGLRIGFRSSSLADSRYERTIIENDGEIFLKGRTWFGSGTRISNCGELIIGENFAITANSSIVCHKKISFGNDVMVSWNCLFMDTDFHQVIDQKTQQLLNEPKEILVGNHVWIGCSCILLKGTQIADGCVIAANSHINSACFDKNCVITGLPMKVLKKDIEWRR